jgi:hypothetical protein
LIAAIAAVIMTMRNCSVAGNIARHRALSNLPFQAPYPLEFLRQSPRSFSAHHVVAAAADSTFCIL